MKLGNTLPVAIEPKTVTGTQTNESKLERAEAEPRELSESETSPQVTTKKTTTLSKDIARSVFDSVLRGPLRYFESFIESQLLRVLYRLVTELARKTSELAFMNVLDKKKVFSMKDFIDGSVRALEHVPATVMVEPNLFDSTIPRVLAGIGNMAVRFVTRFGFYATKSIDRDALGEKNMLDEFTSRSLFRVVYTNSDNLVIAIGTRILEQLLINLNLHVFKPLGRLFPQFANFFNKSQNPEKL